MFNLYDTSIVSKYNSFDILNSNFDQFKKFIKNENFKSYVKYIW